VKYVYAMRYAFPHSGLAKNFILYEDYVLLVNEYKKTLEALKFYADESTYRVEVSAERGIGRKIDDDMGDIARAVVDWEVEG